MAVLVRSRDPGPGAQVPLSALQVRQSHCRWSREGVDATPALAVVAICTPEQASCLHVTCHSSLLPRCCAVIVFGPVQCFW